MCVAAIRTHTHTHPNIFRGCVCANERADCALDYVRDYFFFLVGRLLLRWRFSVFCLGKYMHLAVQCVRAAMQKNQGARARAFAFVLSPPRFSAISQGCLCARARARQPGRVQTTWPGRQGSVRRARWWCRSSRLG